MSSLSRLRRFWFDVHMWLGVGLFLVLIPVCVSGSYLVWKEPIDALTHPGRSAVTAGPALPPAAYLESAQATFGDKARVNQVRMPAHAGAPVVVTGSVAGGEGAQRGRARTLTAWVDPGSARVLEVADTSQSFTQWVHRLHGSLVLPANGRKIVGWLGWAMLASSLTGLWLWWPRNGKVALGFRWKRTASTLMNLHYLTGFWVCIPLAVLSLTGALISFPQTFRGMVGAVAPLGAQQQRGPGGGGGAPMPHPMLSANEAARLARSEAPDAELRSVALPSQARPVWRVQMERDGKIAEVTVADDTGAVKAAAQAGQPVGDQIIRWNRKLHDGTDTGLVWRVVITLGGLIPALLGVTGVIIWARRQLGKVARGRELAPAE